MRTYLCLLTVFAVGSMLLNAGCEIGTNPVVLDGAPITASLRVDVPNNVLYDSLPVNLGDAMSGIDNEVDSIRIYNVTLLIDSTGTSDSGIIARGGFKLNNDTVLTLVDNPLSAFATERSIFDPRLKNLGFTYDPTMILKLQQYLRQKPQPVVQIAFGILSTSPIHFTAHLKIYTQVFATINN